MRAVRYFVYFESLDELSLSRLLHLLIALLACGVLSWTVPSVLFGWGLLLLLRRLIPLGLR